MKSNTAYSILIILLISNVSLLKIKKIKQIECDSDQQLCPNGVQCVTAIAECSPNNNIFPN